MDSAREVETYSILFKEVWIAGGRCFLEWGGERAMVGRWRAQAAASKEEWVLNGSRRELRRRASELVRRAVRDSH